MFEALMTEVDAISTQISPLLLALKEATLAKNNGAIALRSSELMGPINLLETKYDAMNTESMVLDIPNTLAVLECKKRTVFLLIECFAYVISGKRNILGKQFQKLIVSIYDCANEGMHYLAKDEVFTKYNKIISQTLAFALPCFDEANLHINFYYHIFMPWLHSISAPIRKAAKRYFRDELQTIAAHRVIDVTFEAKPLGVQIGTKAIIKFGDGYPVMTFYVKGHQNYTALSPTQIPSSQRKDIDLKELFVYKVLELIGVGPKVHFITHQSGHDRAFDRNALFIATQDVAYTKLVEYGKTKHFQPISELYWMDEGKKLGDDIFLPQFTGELASTEVTPIKLEATLIDIIARVFRLGDLNEDNFARITITTPERNYEKWRVFDFKIPENLEGRYVIADEESTVEGFIRGNGALRHPNVFLQDAVMGRDRIEKIKLGNEIIELLWQGRPKMTRPEEHKMPLPEALEQSFKIICHYFEEPTMGIKRADLLGINIIKALADLTDYRQSALQNFEHLRNGLRRLSPQETWV